MPPSVARSQLPRTSAHATKEPLRTPRLCAFSKGCCTNNTQPRLALFGKHLFLISIFVSSIWRRNRRCEHADDRFSPFLPHLLDVFGVESRGLPIRILGDIYIPCFMGLARSLAGWRRLEAWSVSNPTKRANPVNEGSCHASMPLTVTSARPDPAGLPGRYSSFFLRDQARSTGTGRTVACASLYPPLLSESGARSIWLRSLADMSGLEKMWRRGRDSNP
jgi:hypothetical protein